MPTALIVCKGHRLLQRTRYVVVDGTPAIEVAIIHEVPDDRRARFLTEAVSTADLR